MGGGVPIDAASLFQYGTLSSIAGLPHRNGMPHNQIGVT